jgi:hypothetical protein
MPRKSSSGPKKTDQKPLPPSAVSTARCDTFGPFTVLHVSQGEAVRLLILDARDRDPRYHQVYTLPPLKALIDRVLVDPACALLYVLVTVEDGQWIHVRALRAPDQIVHVDSTKLRGGAIADWQIDEAGCLQVTTAHGTTRVEELAGIPDRLRMQSYGFDEEQRLSDVLPENFLTFMLSWLIKGSTSWQVHQARTLKADEFGVPILPGERFFGCKAYGWDYAYTLSYHTVDRLWRLCVAGDGQLEKQLRQAFDEWMK